MIKRLIDGEEEVVTKEINGLDNTAGSERCVPILVPSIDINLSKLP